MIYESNMMLNCQLVKTFPIQTFLDAKFAWFVLFLREIYNLVLTLNSICVDGKIIHWPVFPSFLRYLSRWLWLELVLGKGRMKADEDGGRQLPLGSRSDRRLSTGSTQSISERLVGTPPDSIASRFWNKGHNLRLVYTLPVTVPMTGKASLPVSGDASETNI